MTAALAGIDAGSDNPIERLRFLVFQRQQVMEVMKTKAIMLSSLGNADGAQKAATEYLDMAIPIGSEDAELQAYRKERLMKEIEKMAPIPLSSIRFGDAIKREAFEILDKRTGKAIPAVEPPQFGPVPKPVKGATAPRAKGPPISGPPKIPSAPGKARPK